MRGTQLLHRDTHAPHGQQQGVELFGLCLGVGWSSLERLSELGGKLLAVRDSLEELESLEDCLDLWRGSAALEGPRGDALWPC